MKFQWAFTTAMIGVLALAGCAATQGTASPVSVSAQHTAEPNSVLDCLNSGKTLADCEPDGMVATLNPTPIPTTTPVSSPVVMATIDQIIAAFVAACVAWHSSDPQGMYTSYCQGASSALPADPADMGNTCKYGSVIDDIDAGIKAACQLVGL